MEKIVILESTNNYNQAKLLSSLSAPTLSSPTSTSSPIKRKNAHNLANCNKTVTCCYPENLHKIVTKFAISQRTSALMYSMVACGISKCSMDMHVWKSGKSRQTGTKRRRHKSPGPLPFVLLARFLLPWLMLLLTTTTSASPVYIDGHSLEPFQSGRNIRHLPCIVRKTGRSGICMFAIDCIKQNGTHLGTCIDRFYFGSCCSIKDIPTTTASTTTTNMPLTTTLTNMFTSEITDNSIDQNTISHHFNISNMIVAHLKPQETTTTATVTTTQNILKGNSSDAINDGSSLTVNRTNNKHFNEKTPALVVESNSTSFSSVNGEETAKPAKIAISTTTKRPQIPHSTHKNSHFVIRTTPRPSMSHLKFSPASTASFQTTRRKYTSFVTTKPQSSGTTTTFKRLSTSADSQIYSTTNHTPGLNVFTTPSNSIMTASALSTMTSKAAMTSTTERMAASETIPAASSLGTGFSVHSFPTTTNRPVLTTTFEPREAMTIIPNSDKLFTFQIVETTTTAPVQEVLTESAIINIMAPTTPFASYMNKPIVVANASDDINHYKTPIKYPELDSESTTILTVTKSTDDHINVGIESANMTSILSTIPTTFRIPMTSEVVTTTLLQTTETLPSTSLASNFTETTQLPTETTINGNVSAHLSSMAIPNFVSTTDISPPITDMRTEQVFQTNTSATVANTSTISYINKTTTVNVESVSISSTSEPINISTQDPIPIQLSINTEFLDKGAMPMPTSNHTISTDITFDSMPQIYAKDVIKSTTESVLNTTTLGVSLVTWSNFNYPNNNKTFYETESEWISVPTVSNVISTTSKKPPMKGSSDNEIVIPSWSEANSILNLGSLPLEVGALPEEPLEGADYMEQLLSLDGHPPLLFDSLTMEPIKHKIPITINQTADVVTNHKEITTTEVMAITTENTTSSANTTKSTTTSADLLSTASPNNGESSLWPTTTPSLATFTIMPAESMIVTEISADLAAMATVQSESSPNFTSATVRPIIEINIPMEEELSNGPNSKPAVTMDNISLLSTNTIPATTTTAATSSSTTTTTTTTTTAPTTTISPTTFFTTLTSTLPLTTTMPTTTTTYTSTLPPPMFPLENIDYRQICGRRMFPEPRIVGGANAAFGRWPWQISLRQWRTSTYLHKCGAVLLNENWAITAAHCVDNVPPSDLLLRLGQYDLAEEEEPYGYQERRVQIVASHPQFDARTFEYDLALLRFYEPVQFQPNIIPVCVPDSDENFIGQTAFVTGWGRLYDDGPLPSVLQEVAVPVINNTICEWMYRAAGYIEHIPHIFICAGWKKGGHDSCEGDSGGPMVLQRESDKRFQLGGVISWGIGCAESNQPGVYTRISEFRDWINQILQF